MSDSRLPNSSRILNDLGLPTRDGCEPTASKLRFDDGRSYRVEIPSTESPEAFAAVVDEAKARNVRVDRVSQGSGIWLMTDDELRDYAALGRDNHIETVLFLGPRDSWGYGVQHSARSGAVSSGATRGADGLRAVIDEALRAAEFGINGVLVADVGALKVLGELKQRGDLPASFVLKVSISFPVTNPATAQVLEQLGATSLNLPTDLAVETMSSIRAATTVPLDMYIEAADEFGGGMRYYESCDIVRALAPVYLKYTVRNAPGIYPAGGHLRSMVLDLARERVRRAECGLRILKSLAAE